MKVLKTIIRYPLECVSGGAFFGMAIIIFIQVIWRYLFRSPFIWPEELAKLLFVWSSLLGAAIGLRRGSHFRIDFFINSLSKKGRAIFDLTTDIFLCFLVSYWGWQGIRGLNAAILQHFAALQISMVWLYIPLPVCCGLMLLFLLIQLYRDVNALIRSVEV